MPDTPGIEQAAVNFRKWLQAEMHGSGNFRLHVPQQPTLAFFRSKPQMQAVVGSHKRWYLAHSKNPFKTSA